MPAMQGRIEQTKDDEAEKCLTETERKRISLT